MKFSTIKSLFLGGTIIVLLASCSNQQLPGVAEADGPTTPSSISTQDEFIKNIPQTTQGYQHQVMVLGSFHFNRSTDASDVVAKNHIDIKSSKNQLELENIVDKIVSEFKPTAIAVEFMPKWQTKIDSFYSAYQNGHWELGKNEAFQLGFRVAKKMNLPSVYCIDNRPDQPKTVVSVDDWDLYAEALNQTAVWHEYDEDNNNFNNYVDEMQTKMSVQEYLALSNSPTIKKRHKELWLTGLVNLGYQDKYIGADLTGHWYRRNTRIFVNARNLCKSKNERILIIYGNMHKWVLDELFDGSPEFEVIQPTNILN